MVESSLIVLIAGMGGVYLFLVLLIGVITFTRTILTRLEPSPTTPASLATDSPHISEPTVSAHKKRVMAAAISAYRQRIVQNSR